MKFKRNNISHRLSRTAAAVGTVVALPSSVFAQSESIGDGFEAAQPTNRDTVSVPEIVARVIDILLWAVGIASVIMLIVGGIRYVVSAGDQNAVQGAKNTILYAIVGLVVAFLAFALVEFVLGGLTGTGPGV